MVKEFIVQKTKSINVYFIIIILKPVGISGFRCSGYSIMIRSVRINYSWIILKVHCFVGNKTGT
jgi:hypothetical protein